MAKDSKRKKIMIIFLSFIGMICWGIAPIFVKLGLKDINPIIGLTIRTIVTISLLCGFVFLSGNVNSIRNISKGTLILLTLEAILATFIGDLAYFVAIKHGAVTLVTIIMASSPLVTIVCSMFFLNEPITYARMVGAILIICGIIIAI